LVLGSVGFCQSPHVERLGCWYLAFPPDPG